MASKAWRSGQRAQPRRARRGWRKEHASLASLEGVFVGMFMITSVAIVTTLDDEPPASTTSTRSDLEQTLHGLLQGLEVLSTADRYMTQIERAIGKAVVGNTTDLDRFLERTLPTGAECRLWIDNGKERRMLVGADAAAPRESVGVSRFYHPTWAYAVAVPAVDVVAAGQPLQVAGYAVSQGALVKEAGVPVEVEVKTGSGTYGRNAITAIRDGPAASLVLKDGSGQPTLIHRNQLGGTGTQSEPVYGDTDNETLQSQGNFTVDRDTGLLSVTGSFTGDVISYVVKLTAPNGTEYPLAVTGTLTASLSHLVAAAEGVWDVTVTGGITGIITPKRSNLTIDLVTDGILNLTIGVAETADAPLAAGTTLTVRLPYLFESISATNTTQDGWRNITPGKTTKDGVFVTAELASDLRNAERTLVVRAAPPATPDALYRVEASLGSGSYARATFVVNPLGVLVSLDNALQRGPYLAHPKPMAPGKPSTWGVVFPATAVTLAGLPETVTQLDLRSTDGTKLFGAIAPVYPANGWTLVDETHLRWTGTLLLLPNAVSEWIVNTTAAAAPTPFEPASDFPIEFANGAFYQVAERSNPYVFTTAIEPSTTGRGYDVPSFGEDLKGTATLGVNWYARALRLTGNATYEVSAAPDLAGLGEALRLGLARSRLDFSASKARVGDVVKITPDYSGLYETLTTRIEATNGQLVMAGWEVDVQVLDPLQPFQGRDQWKPLSESTTTATRGELNYTVARDEFYGPHAVIAEASFSITNTATGNVTLQTVRMLGVLDVIPDGGQSETALYWISLECWMPDWA